MKKPQQIRLLLLATLFILPSFCFGQDLLVKKNGDDLKVKIVEIGMSVVKYRDYAKSDAPILSIAKKDIFFIRFENGMKQTFEDTPTGKAAYEEPVNQSFQEEVAEVPMDSVTRLFQRTRRDNKVFIAGNMPIAEQFGKQFTKQLQRWVLVDDIKAADFTITFIARQRGKNYTVSAYFSDHQTGKLIYESREFTENGRLMSHAIKRATIKLVQAIDDEIINLETKKR